MGLQDLKLTEEERQSLGVVALADRPQMPAQSLKERFDALGNKIGDHFNHTIDEIQHIEDDYVAWIEAEDGRVEAETVRVGAETVRTAAEDERLLQENTRCAAEEARADAEKARVAAEEKRVDTEAVRETKEDTRQNAECARIAQEEARTLAEVARVDAEAARNVWGEYDEQVSYIPGHKVVFYGSSYLCIAACRGVWPNDPAHWQLIAARGVDGEGAGDMLAGMYDPQGKQEDVFRWAENMAQVKADAVQAHADAGIATETVARVEAVEAEAAARAEAVEAEAAARAAEVIARKAAITAVTDKVGDIVYSARNLETEVQPQGTYLRCDGRTINRHDFPALFDVVGYQYSLPMTTLSPSGGADTIRSKWTHAADRAYSVYCYGNKTTSSTGWSLHFTLAKYSTTSTLSSGSINVSLEATGQSILGANMSVGRIHLMQSKENPQSWYGIATPVTQSGSSYTLYFVSFQFSVVYREDGKPYIENLTAKSQYVYSSSYTSPAGYPFSYFYIENKNCILGLLPYRTGSNDYYFDLFLVNTETLSVSRSTLARQHGSSSGDYIRQFAYNESLQSLVYIAIPSDPWGGRSACLYRAEVDFASCAITSTALDIKVGSSSVLDTGANFLYYPQDFTDAVCRMNWNEDKTCTLEKITAKPNGSTAIVSREPLTGVGALNPEVYTGCMVAIADRFLVYSRFTRLPTSNQNFQSDNYPYYTAAVAWDIRDNKHVFTNPTPLYFSQYLYGQNVSATDCVLSPSNVGQYDCCFDSDKFNLPFDPQASLLGPKTTVDFSAQTTATTTCNTALPNNMYIRAKE